MYTKKYQLRRRLWENLNFSNFLAMTVCVCMNVHTDNNYVCSYMYKQPTFCSRRKAYRPSYVFDLSNDNNRFKCLCTMCMLRAVTRTNVYMGSITITVHQRILSP
jgi:hypothetical protein